MPEPLTAEELDAMRHLAQVTPYLGEAVDEIERLKAALERSRLCVKRKADVIRRLQTELAAAQENAVSDRVKLDAALVGQKAALERCVGYTRDLAAAREDTARLDWLTENPSSVGYAQGWAYKMRGDFWIAPDPRAALDAARKESR